MLEYERQAEERAKEQEAMQDERDRMQREMDRIQAEQDRIAQEEYEMRQYYEAEALKHAEEVRLHQEGAYFRLLQRVLERGGLQDRSLLVLGRWFGKMGLGRAGRGGRLLSRPFLVALNFPFPWSLRD
jgi:hypothetical protein